MHEHSPDRTQRFYARLAGFLFLFVMAIFIAGELITSRIRGAGDFAEATGRILASELLYRVGLLSTAVGALGVLLLSYALYVTLEPVNRRLAALALYARIGEAFIIGAVLVFRFAALRLYAAAEGSGGGVAQDDPWAALTSFTGSAYGSGVQIWLMFCSLGSVLFFYLFYQSRYIPRPLAGLGVLGSILLMVVSVGILLFPEHADTIQYGWAASFVAEVTTGFWLLISGIRPAPAGARTAG
jgi:hypothetical protein